MNIPQLKLIFGGIKSDSRWYVRVPGLNITRIFSNLSWDISSHVTRFGQSLSWYEGGSNYACTSPNNMQKSLSNCKCEQYETSAAVSVCHLQLQAFNLARFGAKNRSPSLVECRHGRIIVVYVVSRRIKPRILNLSIRRDQSNLNIIFRLTVKKESVVSVGQFSFDCRSYYRRKHCMQAGVPSVQIWQIQI